MNYEREAQMNAFDQSAFYRFRLLLVLPLFPKFKGLFCINVDKILAACGTPSESE